LHPDFFFIIVDSAKCDGHFLVVFRILNVEAVRAVEVNHFDEHDFDALDDVEQTLTLEHSEATAVEHHLDGSTLGDVAFERQPAQHALPPDLLVDVGEDAALIAAAVVVHVLLVLVGVQSFFLLVFLFLLVFEFATDAHVLHVVLLCQTAEAFVHFFIAVFVDGVEVGD